MRDRLVTALGAAIALVLITGLFFQTREEPLRRAARLADRVIVLVRSNAMTALALRAVQRRLGREDGIGYIVMALPEELETLPDRVGNVVEFWKS